jgi:hypothetical protein
VYLKCVYLIISVSTIESKDRMTKFTKVSLYIRAQKTEEAKSLSFFDFYLFALLHMWFYFQIITLISHMDSPSSLTCESHLSGLLNSFH